MSLPLIVFALPLGFNQLAICSLGEWRISLAQVLAGALMALDLATFRSSV